MPTAHEDQHRLNKKRNRLRELQDADSPGLSFAQKVELIKNQVCFKCQKLGHKAHQCKEKKEEATANRQPASGDAAAQIIDDEEPKSWMD